VNDGMITSSPGPIPARRVASSSAAVPDGVSSAHLDPVSRSSRSEQRALNGPVPERCPLSNASRRFASSEPAV
jgi:hypothetical protein